MTPIELEVRDHLEWMKIHNYAATTIECRERYLGYFVAFVRERGVHEAKDVHLELLLAYQHSLFAQRKRDGQPLSFGTQAQRLIPVSQFFSWLRREHRVDVNPATDLLMPRPDRRLPEATLSATEMATLLATPDVSRPLGLRDRAVLEVFYSCGLRRSELISLWLRDVDFDRGTLFVRRGKGPRTATCPSASGPSSGFGCTARSFDPDSSRLDFRTTCSYRPPAPRCARTGSVERCGPTWLPPASTRRAAATSCATPWPPSCSRVAPISGTWPRCSAMPDSRPPSATPE